jgi:hypothetical protein
MKKPQPTHLIGWNSRQTKCTLTGLCRAHGSLGLFLTPLCFFLRQVLVNKLDVHTRLSNI